MRGGGCRHKLLPRPLLRCQTDNPRNRATPLHGPATHTACPGCRWSTAAVTFGGQNGQGCWSTRAAQGSTASRKTCARGLSVWERFWGQSLPGSHHNGSDAARYPQSSRRASRLQARELLNSPAVAVKLPCPQPLSEQGRSPHSGAHRPGAVGHPPPALVVLLHALGAARATPNGDVAAAKGGAARRGGRGFAVCWAGTRQRCNPRRSFTNCCCVGAR